MPEVGLVGNFFFFFSCFQSECYFCFCSFSVISCVCSYSACLFSSSISDSCSSSSFLLLPPPLSLHHLAPIPFVSCFYSFYSSSCVSPSNSLYSYSSCMSNFYHSSSFCSFSSFSLLLLFYFFFVLLLALLIRTSITPSSLRYSSIAATFPSFLQLPLLPFLLLFVLLLLLLLHHLKHGFWHYFSERQKLKDGLRLITLNTFLKMGLVARRGPSVSREGSFFSFVVCSPSLLSIR